MNPKFVHPGVLQKARQRKLSLFLSLLFFTPLVVLALVNKSPQEFLEWTGYTYTPFLWMSSFFVIAGGYFAYRTWRCPACDRFLGLYTGVAFCPRCATYISKPTFGNILFTNELQKARGAALIAPEEYQQWLKSDEVRSARRRAMTQIVIFAGTAIIIGVLSGIAGLNEQASKPGVSILLESVGYMILTFVYCWHAAFFFYLDEKLLAFSSSWWMKVVAGIYNFFIIKLIFVFIVSGMIMVLSAGLLGLREFYLALVTANSSNRPGIPASEHNSA